MKAHINHDLPIALAPTCAAFGMEPERESYQYRDFKAVNDILGAVEPQALEHLATGLLGMVVQNLGRLRHVLSMWSVTTARDTAWTKPSWAGTFATGPSRDRTSFSCSTA
jgi:hypothetical protein